MWTTADGSHLQMRERQVQVPGLLLHHGRGLVVGSLCWLPVRCSICFCCNLPAQPCPPYRTLRCQCKHKHTEHDPVSKACTKAACRCEGFHSPWHCNCNHPWAEHTQVGQQHLHGVLKACLPSVPCAGQNYVSQPSLSPACSSWRRGRCSHWRLCWRGFRWHHSMRPWLWQTLLLAMTWQAGIT